MPKEIIRSQHYGMTVTDADGKQETLDKEPFLHLGWLKDCNVELAVLKPKDHGPDHVDADGWFIQLDRHGINRLIRTLRKARDQVFGSDA